MAKQTDLEAKFDRVFHLNERIGAQKHRISAQQTILNRYEKSLRNELIKARELMRQGQRLEDPIQDYCFFHYGFYAPENTEAITIFLSELEEYSGQLILENLAGYTAHNLPVCGGLQKVDREIRLARLSSDGEGKPYEIVMPHRHLKARTKSPTKEFIRETGWQDTTTDSFYLNVYVNAFIGNSETKDLDEQLKKIIEAVKEHSQEIFLTPKLKEIQGFRVDISPPFEIDSQPRIGGTRTEYDSEPHQSLIVGDEAVKKYLEGQDLTVEAIKAFVAGIPEL